MLVIHAKTVDNTFEVSVVELVRVPGCVTEESVTLYPGKFQVHNYYCQYSVHEAIARAKSKVNGEKVYNLCEHSVRWANTGEKKSKQMRSYSN